MSLQGSPRFCPAWLQRGGGSHDPFLSFDNLLQQHTELREPLSVHCFIIKDLTKDTDEQPDVEVNIGPRVQELVPVGLACVTLPACECVHQLKSPPHAIV